MTKKPIDTTTGSPSRRAVFALAAGGALGLPLIAGRPARAEDDKPTLMFVQMAARTVADDEAKTIRLVDLSPQTLYFADRPERLAGHVRLADFLKEWTASAGPDNFAGDPPNAAISIYQPNQADSTVAIIEITNPRPDGADLIYDYKVISGNPPVSGGETALFIDSIGIGGGVGVGFHGVGVGVRGPGFR